MDKNYNLFLSLTGYIIFNKCKYLVSEYLVVGSYTLAHFSIFSFIYSILILLFSPKNYMLTSFISIALMVSYAIYVVNKLNKYKTTTRILRSFIFFITFLFAFFGVSLLINLILILTGIIDLQDFVPPK